MSDDTKHPEVAALRETVDELHRRLSLYEMHLDALTDCMKEWIHAFDRHNREAMAGEMLRREIGGRGVPDMTGVKRGSTVDRAIDVLRREGSPMSAKSLSLTLGIRCGTLRASLDRAVARGLISKPGRGVYALPESLR